MSSELTPGEIGRLQKKLLFEMLANVDLQRDNERLRERIEGLENKISEFIHGEDEGPKGMIGGEDE